MIRTRSLARILLEHVGRRSDQLNWSETDAPLRLTKMYYTLRSSLQIPRSAAFNDGTSRAGDFEIWQRFIEGFYNIKTTACVWIYTCYTCIKHNTRMIRLYRTSNVSKDLNNANWVTLIVKLYSVTMNNRIRNVSSFDRTPRSMCSQVSNNEHATSHHLTRLNVEFAYLIATYNNFSRLLNYSNFHTRLCWFIWRLRNTLLDNYLWLAAVHRYRMGK